MRRLGIVANEFFDPGLARLNGQFEPALGRSGGFGWAAAHAARALEGRMEVVFISTEHRALDGRSEASTGGHRLLLAPLDPGHWRALLRREGLDALLAIDYRLSYKPVLEALPRTPLVVWARDPRSSEDIERIETLRVPGDDSPPQGIGFNDCTSLPQAARPTRRRRRFVLASPSPRFLAPRSGLAYGMPVEQLALLPNPVPVPEPRRRSEHPVVVFLGRLDPIKRPWLAVELARRLPGVRFLMVGEAHFDGRGSWTPSGLPPNVELLGRRGGSEKLDILGSAWALVNTSIHEGFPVSFMEALALGTPVVAAVDPEGAVSRFGACVDCAPGDGLASLAAFETALRDLLADGHRRERLGREAREWVLSVHTPERFADRLEALLSARR